ncbi:Sodium/potassium-transporting ATPase subunit alpha, partial [Diplonema papillatum]
MGVTNEEEMHAIPKRSASTVEEKARLFEDDEAGRDMQRTVDQMNERRKLHNLPEIKPDDYTIEGEGDSRKLIWSQAIRDDIANMATGSSGVVPLATKKVSYTRKNASKVTESKEVQYWQVAAKIENGECDPVYLKPHGMPQDNDIVWEKSKILTDINHSKPGDSKGLSDAEHAELFASWGRNELTPKNVVPAWRKFLSQFTGFFALLLEVGGLLCFIAFAVDTESPENLYLGVVLWIVVIITAVFSFWQEQSADNMMQKFKEMGGSKNVIRRNDGPGAPMREVELPSTEIVPGDVCVLRLGDKITADFRVLATIGEFKCEQSALTGEPDALTKNTEPNECRANMEHAGLIEQTVTGDVRGHIMNASDRWAATHDGKPGMEDAIRCSNIAMFGTNIKEGKAVALCVATGDWTVMGMLYEMTTQESDEETPLAQEIHRFVY